VILTALTVLAGAALGGGIALVLLAAVNGVRMLGEMSDSLS
jgi:hypothetical protein